MTKTIEEITVFVSSPGDVAKERDLTEGACNSINTANGSDAEYRIRVVRWEKDVSPAKGESGQDVINDQIGDTYDIFIGILGARFGSPTTSWGSGTEEEFRRAFKRASTTGSPEILFYFSDRELSLSAIDADQLKKVRDFQAQLRSLGVLYSIYTDDLSLSARLFSDITKATDRVRKKAPSTKVQLREQPSEFDPLATYNDLVSTNDEVRYLVTADKAVKASGNVKKTSNSPEWAHRKLKQTADIQHQSSRRPHQERPPRKGNQGDRPQRRHSPGLFYSPRVNYS